MKQAQTAQHSSAPRRPRGRALTVRRSALLLALLLSILALTFNLPVVDAQVAGPERQPLDVMLVVDNSCSMFPAEQRIPGCEVWGNDPDFLRITGASLFIARTGFALPAAGDYQLGVVSMGDNPPELISPLTGLDQARDALAAAINNPQPKLATQIVPALQMAYRELRESPNRRPGNLPAVVLLTDGAPFPAEGQSSADIEALVAGNPDVPLFVILLQNRDTGAAPAPNTNYEQYIRFWNDMALRYNFVRSYPVNSTEDIERTYDEIVARLENTVARPPLSLAPGQTLEVFISRYIQRVVFTFTRERGAPPADIAITDPAGARVAAGDPDTQFFEGQDNPVQIVAVGRGRLEAAPRDAVWKITSSEQVVVHIDMEGSYRVQFVEPAASRTAVPGQFLVDRPHPTGQPFSLRLLLADNASGAAVTEPQPLKITVTGPDGNASDVPGLADLRPDAEGVYTIPYDLPAGDGRDAFSVEAGSVGDPSGGTFPVARAELLVDSTRTGFIEQITPEQLQCAPGQAASLVVAVAGLDAGQLGAARASALAGGREVALTPGQGGAFAADVGALCDALAATLSCGASADASVRVRVTLPGGAASRSSATCRRASPRSPARPRQPRPPRSPPPRARRRPLRPRPSPTRTATVRTTLPTGVWTRRDGVLPPGLAGAPRRWLRRWRVRWRARACWRSWGSTPHPPRWWRPSASRPQATYRCTATVRPRGRTSRCEAWASRHARAPSLSAARGCSRCPAWSRSSCASSATGVSRRCCAGRMARSYSRFAISRPCTRRRAATESY